MDPFYPANVVDSKYKTSSPQPEQSSPRWFLKGRDKYLIKSKLAFAIQLRNWL